MTFSFGFSGDDIDADESELVYVPDNNGSVDNAEPLPELVEAKRHGVGEWVSPLYHSLRRITNHVVTYSSIPNIIQQNPCRERGWKRRHARPA
jgi:hypothetical protein